jgi:TonB family protein
MSNRCFATPCSIAFLLLPLCSGAGVPSVKPCIIRLSERNARLIATKIIAPLYPREAETRHIGGVVVTAVRVDTLGRVMSTTVLESTSDILAAAVKRALIQWRFRSNKETEGCCFDTKITYYFLPYADAEGHVVNPTAWNAEQRYRSAKGHPQ